MVDKILNILRDKFYSPWAIPLGFIFFIALLIYTPIGNIFIKLSGIISKQNQILVYIGLFIIIFFLYIFVWYRLYRIPPLKLKDGCAAVVLSIVTENEEQKRKLKNDVILKINDMFQAKQLHDKVELIIPKDHHTYRINNIIKKSENIDLYKKKFKNIRKKCIFSYFICGEMKQRTEGEEKYIINFTSVSSHTVLPLEYNNQLSREMSLVLPNICMPVNNEMSFFEVTTYILYLSIRYIIGVILYLSEDINYIEQAFQIHNGLIEDFEKIDSPMHNQLKNQVKKLYGMELHALSRHYYELGNNDLAFRYSEESIKHFRHPVTNYWNGILWFDVHRNTGKSLNCFKQCKGIVSYEILSLNNQAFIKMYLRAFPEGLKLYDLYASKSFEGEEVYVKGAISYSMNLYEKERDKPQLLFLIGFLYYKKLMNYPMALEYFEEFNKTVFRKKNYGKLTSRSRKYINRINTRISCEEIAATNQYKN